MKILFLAPLTRKITPEATASRVRFIFDLTTRLQKRGHSITVLGTKDSRIPGVKIVPVIPKGFYKISSSFENQFYAHTSFLAKQIKLTETLSEKFDIIHNHSYPEFLTCLLEKNFACPMITTLHLAMSKELDDVFSLFPKTKIVCSNVAKKIAKKTKIYNTLNHGVDTNLFKFQPNKDDYLLWVGRLSQAKDKLNNFIDPKGVKWAIKLAEIAKSNLKLVANVEDIAFFNQEIKPHLSDKIQWIGPVSFDQPLSKKKIAKLMQKAKAFLAMSEVFGLTAIEAQSCGTPVIGFERKYKTSVVINGKTGILVKKKNGINGLVEALEKISQIDPANCRKNIEENFSLEKMTQSYEKIYQRVIDEYTYKKQT